ncbi:antibiotic biosynthesis monooxygenase [Craterilacuibacter sp. RT1T]|uniref:antibiotic biosynthesis monooxygenase family protein n=1 Tax=Craterilacuibacter sp. RT1T TaxID=2942211 RepID=UPI0020BE0A92|nr:antibiotic biosynthesis monooxygenase [Craterilacuibacter sp. RT1T]MCL6262582.1 antibiotic biosynthesis monooxygenase [Craterilacuibacter sp. RT1T]
MFARTPAPPYWAVIFASQRSDVADAYAEMADAMVALAAEQLGFLGVESVRGDDGFGITVSYWESEEAIAAWKAEGRHRQAQAEGFARWYDGLFTRVACVKRDYAWTRG